MNQEYEENGLVEEKDDKKPYAPTWRKGCSWLAFAISCVVPVVAIGFAIMCLSGEDEEERKEIEILSYIAIGVAAVLLINNFFLSGSLI